MRTVALFPLALAILTGCASSGLEVAQMPQRDADLYPWAQRQAGVTLTVDEIADPARIDQYFGVNLLDEGVLPVTVILSNHSPRSVRIGPADILLLKDRAVIDPLPVQRVADIAKRAIGRLRSAARREVENYFASLAFEETTLAPDTSYQGTLFFPRSSAVETDRFISRLNWYRGAGLKMHVGVTDIETRERLRFGPFRLSGGEEQAYSFGGWRR